MKNFLGRKLISFYMPRWGKEFLFKQYNLLKRPKKIKDKIKYPENISISLTTYCNLRCRFCDREEFNASYMSVDNLKKLEKPIRNAKQIDLTGWGEAILYKNYRECVEYILKTSSQKKIIAQTSNGSLCNRYSDILRGRIKRFVISLNSSSKETYEKEMVGGKFNKTLKNIDEFLKNIDDSDRENVKLHFVTYTENYSEMPRFVKLASELGVPTVSFGQMMANKPDEKKYTLLNIKDEYNNALKEVERAGRQYKIEVFYRRFGEDLGLDQNKCNAPFNELFIRTNGDISPCCYFGDTSFGNVFNNDFDEVWFSKKGLLNRLRKKRDLKECDVCAPFHNFDSEFIHQAARLNQWSLGEINDYSNKGLVKENQI